MKVNISYNKNNNKRTNVETKAFVGIKYQKHAHVVKCTYFWHI